MLSTSLGGLILFEFYRFKGMHEMHVNQKPDARPKRIVVGHLGPKRKTFS